MVDKHPLEPFLHPARHTAFNARQLPSSAKNARPWSFSILTSIMTCGVYIGNIFRAVTASSSVDSENKCYRRDVIVKLLEEKGIGLYDTATGGDTPQG